jgi:hypothetical protein
VNNPFDCAKNCLNNDKYLNIQLENFREEGLNKFNIEINKSVEILNSTDTYNNFEFICSEAFQEEKGFFCSQLEAAIVLSSKKNECLQNCLNLCKKIRDFTKDNSLILKSTNYYSFLPVDISEICKEKSITFLRNEIGISTGSYVWLKNVYRESKYDSILDKMTYTVKVRALEKVKIINIDYQSDNKYIGFDVELATATNIDKLHLNFLLSNTKNLNWKNEIFGMFYLKDPFPYLKKKWGGKVVNSIRNGEIFIGMTDEQVRMSLGYPDDINRTVNAWGVNEQWVYEDYELYLYFDNGKLTSWQD